MWNATLILGVACSKYADGVLLQKKKKRLPYGQPPVNMVMEKY